MTLIYLVCIESLICCYFQDNLFACEFQQEVFTHHFFNCFPSFCFVFWNWTNMYVGTLILPYRPLKLWSFFFILFLLFLCFEILFLLFMTKHIANCNLATLETRFSPSPVFADILLRVAVIHLFSDLWYFVESCSHPFVQWPLQTIFAIIIFLVICGHSDLCFINFAVNYLPQRYFLKCLDPIRKAKQ